jgi:uncharacterized protein YbjT (DUF2867 family)
MRILVTGATGNIGRHVVAGLREQGVTVRAMTRNPAALDIPGVETVPGDLTDPTTVEKAADGTDAAFLLWPFLEPDGADAVASALGTRHVVYVSAMSASQGGVWGAVENAVKQSDATWTFLRPGGFATNTLEWAPAIRAGGPVRMPFPQAKRSLIHERDIAEVAVVALTGGDHAGKTYVLTGPSALTMAEQVKIIGDAAGSRPEVEVQPPDEARAAVVRWAGEAFADLSMAYLASLVDEPEPVTHTVDEVTGRPARTFAEWAHDHAGDFRPLSTVDIADRYTDAFRQGRMDLAIGFYAPDILRVAPIEGVGELRGLPSIMDNAARLTGDREIHGVTVAGPFVNGDRFAVRFEFDHGDSTSAKMSLYTVDGGAIVREEVFYLSP